MTGTPDTPASPRTIGGIAVGTIGLGAMPLSVGGAPTRNRRSPRSTPRSTRVYG